MRKPTNLARLLGDLIGAGFVALDSETRVPLKGGRKNPMQGRVTKRCVGHQVIVFPNHKSNGYENMVRRRLDKEGKDPDAFELGPRKWGTRMVGAPIIEHTNKDGVFRQYLEVIFLRAAQPQYLLDGEPIDKQDIVGLDEPAVDPDSQGGLERKVIVRTYAMDSITCIRYDQLNVVGPFEYKD
jgi:hypothetical protein